MILPAKVRAVVAAMAVTGAATLAVAGVLAPRTGVGPVGEFVSLTLLLGLTWAFPVLVLRTEETEAFQLDEAFFVAMALLLPPAGVLFGFATAVAAGLVFRRRPLVRAVFNVGQTVTATGLGLAAMYLIAPGVGTPLTARVVGAALAGAAVFALTNSAVVSVIISLNEKRPAARVFTEGLDLRVLVWAGGTSLGLLAAIGAAANPWSLLLAAVPMAALNLILREHAHARRETRRAEGLLTVANQVHAAVALGNLEQTVVAATRSLLQCRHARFDSDLPRAGEIGAWLPDAEAIRWLIAGEPIGFERLGKSDRELLEVIAGITTVAMENARLVEGIRHRAIHDPLTDLPNKLLFVDRLQHALASNDRLGQRMAVMFLDLDQFKVINDSLGHEAGDQVLLGVAARLKASLRQGDTAARLGGDEFAILCENVDDLDDGILIAERVRAAAAGTSVTKGGEVSVTTSVGVVMVEPDSTMSAEELLQAADTAMYRAKERGRDRVETFDDGLRRRAVLRLETEATLRAAIEEGRLRVFYQPIVEAASGRVVEVEALLRVETAAGILAPADFIEVAEQSGLIATIGLRVLEEACRQAVRWRERFGDDAPRRVAVNLSARQLTRIPVREAVQTALATTGCPPEMLALEITETVLMEAGQDVRAELEDLRNLGVTIGLDDFGTGYSSLAYLKRFPVSFVKIDRCFVAGLGQNPEDEAIVDAMISLARSLGLSTIAEGVETTDQLARLRLLGCDRLQGYLIARPTPASGLESLFAGNAAWQPGAATSATLTGRP
ncbi:MAG: putative bifunctional diguanylate cyclase/phosphodiesterase [Acidimicrobiales bacterium]